MELCRSGCSVWAQNFKWTWIGRNRYSGKPALTRAGVGRAKKYFSGKYRATRSTPGRPLLGPGLLVAREIPQP